MISMNGMNKKEFASQYIQTYKNKWWKKTIKNIVLLNNKYFQVLIIRTVKMILLENHYVNIHLNT